jgi:hypothetical protein
MQTPYYKKNRPLFTLAVLIAFGKVICDGLGYSISDIMETIRRVEDLFMPKTVRRSQSYKHGRCLLHRIGCISIVKVVA